MFTFPDEAKLDRVNASDDCENVGAADDVTAVSGACDLGLFVGWFKPRCRMKPLPSGEGTSLAM